MILVCLAPVIHHAGSACLCRTYRPPSPPKKKFSEQIKFLGNSVLNNYFYLIFFKKRLEGGGITIIVHLSPVRTQQPTIKIFFVGTVHLTV